MASKRVRKGKATEPTEAAPPTDAAKLEVALGELEALKVEHAVVQQRCERALLERVRSSFERNLFHGARRPCTQSCSSNSSITVPDTSIARTIQPHRTGVHPVQDRVSEFFEIARAEVEAVERSHRLKDIDLETEEDRHLIELKVRVTCGWGWPVALCLLRFLRS